MNTETTTKRAFGLSGTVVSLIALSVAVLHFFLEPIESPQPIETTVVDIGERIKAAASARLRGEEYVQPAREERFRPDRAVRLAVIIGGLLVIILGVIGLVRREEKNPTSIAMAIGGGTILFQFAVFLAGAMLMLALILIILAFFGGG